MSRWTEQFQNHTIHATLDWLYESVSKEFNDKDVSEKRRFLKLVNKYKEVFGNVDPELVPINQLDSLNNSLKDRIINSHINEYIQNGNVQNLMQANKHLTNQLTTLSVFMCLAEKSPIQNPIVELEKLVDVTISTLVKKIEKSTLSVEEKELKLIALANQMEQKTLEFNPIVNSWQKQFSTAQESRSKEFSKWRDDFSTNKNSEINATIQKYQEKLDKSSENFNETINNILDDGKDKHQAIIELYEITAGDSVGANYLNNAESEKKQADNWRIISVSFIFFTVAWLLFSFFYNTSVMNIASSSETISQLFPWYTLFVTFSLSGVLLWGSAYAAQQSTKHRNNEKRTRWFTLEIRAINPFINSFEPKERNELKKHLSERMFGQSFNNTENDVKVIDEHVLKTILDAVLSKVIK